ncbi:hypothetical protein D3227_32305 [Mesorhizobium waimense]|uniref:DUF6429 domain-containing protein n=1 Tax=Mesorhizobium waimense TaxID=1300307 RepID=A0A3A5KAS1_9HYPH|nr:DUF6429 family protein [Mesorhizobium waimense]RJT29443.1 hypothetical protein D3227_32305 [Mesorhizobium waimense]
MEIDTDKIDDAVLARLWLTLHNERCAWKGFDWGVTDRLHQKGLIADPVNKAKSLVLTDEGLRRSEELFRALFTRPTP